MKTCLICGYEDVAKSFTCPMCGEATWSEEYPSEAVIEVPAADAVEAPAPVSRKGKK